MWWIAAPRTAKKGFVLYIYSKLCVFSGDLFVQQGKLETWEAINLHLNCQRDRGVAERKQELNQTDSVNRRLALSF